ncbi:MAG TPA: helix-turn-helix domain-containing protein [Mucilaginibacter sp.]|jgi:AraC-like DNA-binding protein
MELSFTLFDMVVLFGILQGIITAVVLMLNPVKDKSKTLFIFILLTLALLSFKIILHTLGLWELPLFRYFPLAIDTTLQPLLYLYICSITAKEITTPKIVFYFVPTLAFMAYALVIYALTLGLPSLQLKDQLANQLLFNQVKTAEDIVGVISAFIYWLLGYRLIRKYRNWLFNTQSDSRLQEHTWLKNMLLISGILVLAITAVVVLDDLLPIGRNHFIHLQLFYIYLVIITYYLSFKGYRIFSFSPPFNGRRQDMIVAQGIRPAVADIDFSFVQTESPINENYAVIKADIINALENERIYLIAELSIKMMAQHLGYPLAAVSACVNQCFQINFRTLVNRHRVEEVKRKLKNPPAHLSLLGIALECGFNSEASFYRIFRQETGLSPNDYLRNHRE